MRDINASAPIFHCAMGFRGMAGKDGGQAAQPQDWRGRPVCAFCAIGNPSAFFADLRRWGFNPVAEIAFRDHHVYSQEDVQRLNRAAKEKVAAAFLTTEKDLMNLQAQSDFELPLLACAIRAEISEPEKFQQVLLAGIR